jgi:hypothetical protein
MSSQQRLDLVLQGNCRDVTGIAVIVGLLLRINCLIDPHQIIDKVYYIALAG